MISVIKGDITQQAVDAIVNAANSELLPGGGVSGAIHRAAGPQLAQACAQVAPCPPGQARITPGFRLKAKYVIHAVGPIWQGGNANEAHLLRSAYQAALAYLLTHPIQSIAFPSISTGIYGYPLQLAAPVAIQAIKDFFAQNPHLSQTQVFIVAFDSPTYQVYTDALQQNG
ncbi:MAG: macro domain-containing protein [Bacteroidia bacterium]